MIVLQVYLTLLIAMYVVLRLTVPSEKEGDDLMFAATWFLSLPLLVILGILTIIPYAGDLIVNEIKSWRDKNEVYAISSLLIIGGVK